MEGQQAAVMTDSASKTESATPTSSTASASESLQYDYEAQLFGFTPVTLLNGIYNTVTDLYSDALKAFCDTCKEKYPHAMSESELRSARHAVSDCIDQDLAKMFDTLEVYLMNHVLTIPENVVLPEDKIQLRRKSAKEEEELEEKKNDLKRRIIAVKYANAQLIQHLQRTDALQARLDEVLEMMSTDGGTARVSGTRMKDCISYYSETLMNALNTEKQAEHGQNK